MSSFFRNICCCGCFKSSENTIKPETALTEKPKRKLINKQKDSTKENQIKREIIDELMDKGVKKVIIEPNSYQNSVILSNVDDGDEETEDLLIDEQLLTEEFSHPIKFDALSYGMVRTIQRLLSDEQYNQFGLIDVNSEEFSSVEKFMDSIDFDLIESIGSGNYGEVYKAYDRLKKRQMCVKVIDLIEVNNKYETTFVSRDIRVIQKLSHKNIARVYQMIRTTNRIYLVMELSEKGSLGDWISMRGPFSEFTARLLFIPILEGLDHLHSKKIAHRNLKLENILLSENFNPKLSDFCYAIIVDRKRPKSQTNCSSLPYLSPEILQHLPYNPFISDIWSLGVCLYIMINDRLPFNSDIEKEVLKKQLMNNLQFRQSVDLNTTEELKQLIKLMLETDVDLRLDTKQLFKTDWITKQPPTEECFSVRSELN